MHKQSSGTVAGAVADAPLSTTEALRRALAALGSDAQVHDIIDYAREHFGLDAGPEPGTTPMPPAPAEGRAAASAESARKTPRRGKGRGASSES
jgi:hypothetical protein